MNPNKKDITTQQLHGIIRKLDSILDTARLNYCPASVAQLIHQSAAKHEKADPQATNLCILAVISASFAAISDLITALFSSSSIIVKWASNRVVLVASRLCACRGLFSALLSGVPAARAVETAEVLRTPVSTP
jgi:hypothetical protein